jgi:CheY-like chemotaxis protein
MVILNVDDDKDNLEMFCEAVKEINPSIDCIKVNSAHEALKLLHESDRLPNYIFLDLNMPFMDGKTCLKMIKRDLRLSDITVFIFSSASSPADIEECKNLGADFLKKEFSHRRLVDSLKKIIHSHQS